MLDRTQLSDEERRRRAKAIAAAMLEPMYAFSRTYIFYRHDPRDAEFERM